MNALLSDKLVHALGWTLLHSLWQAALVALLFYLVVAFRKKATANLRYGMATSALALIVIMATVTFSYEYFHFQVPLKTTAAQPAEKPFVIYPYALPVQDISLLSVAAKESKASGMSLSAITRFADRYISTVVIAWIFGVLLLSVRFLGGWAFTRRLKHHPGNLSLDYWQKKVQRLAKDIPMEKSVQVMTSGLAKVPMVIGHLKPVILLPAALLASLPPDQIEAILAHELAHIHRKDYWVNMLQSVVEIIFFYHPAVWWLSSIIRTERENCCDDLAVQLCGNTLIYAKALTHIEEIRQHITGFAMAATGKEGSLLQRIERLIHPGADSPNFSGRYISMVLAFLLLLAITAGTGMIFKVNESPDDENPARIFNINSMNQQAVQMAAGEVRNLGKVPHEPKSDQQAEHFLVQKEVCAAEQAALGISSRRVPTSMTDTLPPSEKKKDPFALFDSDSTIDLITKFDFNMVPAPMFTEADTLFPPHVFSFSDSLLRIQLHSLDSLRGLHGPWQDSTIREVREQLEKAMKKAEKNINRIHLRLQDSLASIDFGHLQAELERSEEALMRQSEAFARQAEAFRRRAEEMERRAAELEARAEAKASGKEHSFEQATRILEKELLNDGLIKKEEQYKFEISPGQLKINGKKQPKEVYEKYADLLARAMNVNMEKGNNFSLTKTPY